MSGEKIHSKIKKVMEEHEKDDNNSFKLYKTCRNFSKVNEKNYFYSIND